jgi:hypothetical protein
VVGRSSEVRIHLDPQPFSNPYGPNPTMISIGRDNHPARSDLFPESFRRDPFFSCDPLHFFCDDAFLGFYSLGHAFPLSAIRYLAIFNIF